MEQPNQNPPEAPLIPESEMKLPEEPLGGAANTAAPSRHLFNPLLVALFVFLLVILAVVIIWGETLIGLVWPQDSVELPPLPEEQTANAADEARQWREEIDAVDLSKMDADMNSIETAINADLSAAATGSATTTP